MKNVTKILALLMVLFATQSFAQTKLGHINMQELINLMPERDSAVIKLENYAKDSIRTDFTGQDIISRTKEILNAFVDYIEEENLFA